MSAQVAADLRSAAEVLERDGWTQGELHDQRGCHCLLGAFSVALGITSKTEDDDLLDREWEAMSAMRPVIGTRWLVGWNDEPGRTATEVIAALRAAADLAEADK